MQTQTSSASARRTALRRAAHQIIDRPLVFEDPLAVRIIGEPQSAILSDHGQDWAHRIRAFIAVRSRYAEDRLAEAVRAGVRQYLVLGAGLDTFGCRNASPELRVFEIDHPATQRWKLERLRAAGIAVPATLRFVGVDFEQDDLLQRLSAAGFDAGEASFVSWLGVTPYLAAATTHETLGRLMTETRTTDVVFDYVLPRAEMSPDARQRFDAVVSLAAAAGEPFIGFFTPGQLAAELRGRGLIVIEDLGAAELDARFFANRDDGLAVGDALVHVAWARRAAA